MDDTDMYEEHGYVSSPSPSNEDGFDLMSETMNNDLTARLASSGPAGIAAATAIMSVRKTKRLHSFETNPSIRNRHRKRLLKKLRRILDEYTTRVGQQAVVVIATPGDTYNNDYKVFGTRPLEGVIRKFRASIIDELRVQLESYTPPSVEDDPSLFELPPLCVNGIPTPVEKMTQAQLRTFIPTMLKYSTGRGKPGWGREATRPPWWPLELPWANIRMDVRAEEEKRNMDFSWTDALRQIVVNCYRYHGREDLLPVFADDDIKTAGVEQDGNDDDKYLVEETKYLTADGKYLTEDDKYSTELQTIVNSDGSVGILQIEPTNIIITLPNGKEARVQSLRTIPQANVDANSVSETTIDCSGQLMLIGEDGKMFPVSTML